MSGTHHCGECGKAVFRVHLLGRSIRIDLDPESVIGGDYTFWDPTYGQQLWRAKPRPATVSPPYDISDKNLGEWDGRKAADGRRWFVQHLCGLTAEQVVAERRQRKGA
jgi:hypothetical protein